MNRLDWKLVKEWMDTVEQRHHARLVISIEIIGEHQSFCNPI